MYYRQFLPIAAICFVLGGALLATTYSYKPNIDYPQGWPITALKVPEGSRPFKVTKDWEAGAISGWDASQGHIEANTSGPFPHDRYYVVFRSDLAWGDVLDYCDRIFQAEGYQICGLDRDDLYRSIPPSTVSQSADEFEYQANYVSRDRFRYINIYKTHLCFVFDISVYAKPIDPLNSIGLEDMRDIDLTKPTVQR